MAVTFAELASSPRLEQDSRERVFVARGSTDEDEIQSEAESQLDATDGGFGNRQIRVEPIDGNQGLWEVTASYSQVTAATPPEVGESSFEFEVSTTTTHITQSLFTIESHSPDPELLPANMWRAIGVTEDGVEGCDILTPESRFSETHYISDATVTETYRRQIISLVGKVNNNGFRGYETGEVMLVGIRGGKRASDEVWEITFSFAVSFNATDLEVGEITGITKRGWEYLWVHYEPRVVASGFTTDRIVPYPVGAYVERVYSYGDYSLLGIGS